MAVFSLPKLPTAKPKRQRRFAGEKPATPAATESNYPDQLSGSGKSRPYFQLSGGGHGWQIGAVLDEWRPFTISTISGISISKI
jgi:hypothetical protein